MPENMFTVPDDCVKVVRCKDFKYREKSKWHDGFQCGNPDYGMATAVELRDNDFCSYGEQRGEPG